MAIIVFGRVFVNDGYDVINGNELSLPRVLCR